MSRFWQHDLLCGTSPYLLRSFSGWHRIVPEVSSLTDSAPPWFSPTDHFRLHLPLWLWHWRVIIAAASVRVLEWMQQQILFGRKENGESDEQYKAQNHWIIESLFRDCSTLTTLHLHLAIPPKSIQPWIGLSIKKLITMQPKDSRKSADHSTTFVTNWFLQPVIISLLMFSFLTYFTYVNFC